jgi:hypothetical protein
MIRGYCPWPPSSVLPQGAAVLLFDYLLKTVITNRLIIMRCITPAMQVFFTELMLEWFEA